MPQKRKKENEDLPPGWRWRNYHNGKKKIQIILKRRKFGFKPISAVFDTRRDAKKWWEQQIGRLHNGAVPSPDLTSEQRRTTLAQILRTYVDYEFPKDTAEERKRDPIAAEAESRLRSRVRVICSDPDIADTALHLLRPHHLLAYVKRRQTKDGQREGVASQTARHELNVISAAYDHAVSVCGYEALVNPVRLIPRKHKPRQSQPRERRLEPREKPKLVRLAMKSRNGRALAIAWLLGLETSLRRGQLWAMQWRDIHLHRAEPSVTVAERKGRKGGVEKRECPLSERAIKLLKFWFRHLNAKGHALTWEGEQRSFSCWKNPHQITRAWDRVVQRANLKESLPFHCARHEATSLEAERPGASIMSIKRLTGHRSLASMQRYINLLNQRTRPSEGDNNAKRSKTSVS